MKQQLAAFLATLAIFVPATHAVAAMPPTTVPSPTSAISPRYSYIEDITVGLSVSGTTATYSLSVTGISSVTSISATLQLQEFSGGTWSDYNASWSASAASDTLYKSGTKPVASGGTYRLKVIVTAYAPGGSGSATAYST